MGNCIFCKIAKGEIPSASLYEDEEFQVILDAAPASRGHTLLLTKQHFANLYDMPDDLIQKAMLLVKKVAVAMKAELKCDGLNIVQNNEPAAGQTVFHFHVHLIPRYENDDVGLTWKPGELTEETSNEMVAKLQSIL